MFILERESRIAIKGMGVSFIRDMSFSLGFFISTSLANSPPPEGWRAAPGWLDSFRRGITACVL